MKIIPPALFIFCASIQFLSWHFIALPLFPLSWGEWLNVYVGLLVGAICGSIALWKVVMFLRAKTPLDPRKMASTLLTGGLFRYSRNPIYLALAGGLFAFACILNDAVAVLVIFVFGFLMNQIWIKEEEEVLEEIFKEEYLEYKQKTRRWI